jgi:hypothetical protein
MNDFVDSLMARGMARRSRDSQRQSALGIAAVALGVVRRRSESRHFEKEVQSSDA